MRLISCTPEAPKDSPVLEENGVEVLDCAIKSFMHAIQIEDREAQQYAAY